MKELRERILLAKIKERLGESARKRMVRATAPNLATALFSNRARGFDEGLFF